MEGDQGREQRPVGGAGVPASTGRALAPQRHELILTEVRRRGAVRVTELAALLQVSDMTIRRDLDVLDEAGLLEKVHGGAVVRDERSSNEPGFEAKSMRSLDEKAAIAEQAAVLVTPGAAVGITAGTTTFRLAAELVDVADLTVVTNSIKIAEVFYQAPRADRTVVLTGGVRTPSDALVGPVAVQALRSLHLDLVFMGVHGMHEHAGFTTPNINEAETNRAFVSSSRLLVVLADHTKWNVSGLCTIAPLDACDTIVTDDGLPDAARTVLGQHIRSVVLADPDRLATDLSRRRA